MNRRCCSIRRATINYGGNTHGYPSVIDIRDRLAVLDSEDDRQQEYDGQEHQNTGEHPALRNTGQRFDCTNVTIALVVVLGNE